jgi:catechol 2,3-dioxygenase-like lactoylglutathione lyase family enzyme
MGGPPGHASIARMAVAHGTIRSIRLVTVFVNDHDEALRFYVEVLGLEQRGDIEWRAGFRAVEVAPAESEAALVLVCPSLGPMGPGVAAWAHGHVGVPTGVVFETDDLEAACRALSLRGVRFVEPPTPHPWGGFAARFLDPDENVFVLVQPDAAARPL